MRTVTHPFIGILYCPYLAEGSKLQNHETPENAKKQFVALPFETT